MALGFRWIPPDLLPRAPWPALRPSSEGPGPDRAGEWVRRQVAAGTADASAGIGQVVPAGLHWTPLLITDPDGEQFWPGQSAALAAMTPEVSALERFTAAEGGASEGSAGSVGMREGDTQEGQAHGAWLRLARAMATKAARMAR